MSDSDDDSTVEAMKCFVSNTHSQIEGKNTGLSFGKHPPAFTKFTPRRNAQRNTTQFSLRVLTLSVCAFPPTPSVSLTSPSNNASFNIGARIPLAATASDTDGTVNRVEIYAGVTLIVTGMAAPYPGAPSATSRRRETMTATACGM